MRRVIQPAGSGSSLASMLGQTRCRSSLAGFCLVQCEPWASYEPNHLRLDTILPVIDNHIINCAQQDQPHPFSQKDVGLDRTIYKWACPSLVPGVCAKSEEVLSKRMLTRIDIVFCLTQLHPVGCLHILEMGVSLQILATCYLGRVLVT